MLDQVEATFIQKYGARFHDDARGRKDRFSFDGAWRERPRSLVRGAARSQFDKVLLDHAQQPGRRRASAVVGHRRGARRRARGGRSRQGAGRNRCTLRREVRRRRVGSRRALRACRALHGEDRRSRSNRHFCALRGRPAPRGQARRRHRHRHLPRVADRAAQLVLDDPVQGRAHQRRRRRLTLVDQEPSREPRRGRRREARRRAHRALPRRRRGVAERDGAARGREDALAALPVGRGLQLSRARAHRRRLARRRRRRRLHRSAVLDRRAHRDVRRQGCRRHAPRAARATQRRRRGTRRRS